MGAARYLCKLDIAISLEEGEFAPGITMNPSLVRALSSLGAEIDIDIN